MRALAVAPCVDFCRVLRLHGQFGKLSLRLSGLWRSNDHLPALSKAAEYAINDQPWQPLPGIATVRCPGWLLVHRTRAGCSDPPRLRDQAAAAEPPD